jgi:Polyketide cyclase / dehydrase and lipid transport
MPKHLESIEIARPVEEVWRLLGQPERWLEGYVETRSRSPDYPAPGARNDHTFHTRIDEEVAVQVVRSGRPTLLEEKHEGKTFSRDLRYRLTPSGARALLTVEDEITFKGLAKLASPIALRDVRRRWVRSLERLRAAAETAAPPDAGT